MKKMLEATDKIGGVPLGRNIAKDIYLNGLSPTPAAVVAP
jgi:hypothetical protein